MDTIDVHTHFYPKSYLERLRTVGDIEIRRDPAGRDTIYEHGARVVTLTPRWRMFTSASRRWTGSVWTWR
jgi:hypothetical protein